MFSMNAAQVKREDPDWVKMAARAHVHYRVPGMEQVLTRTNVAFKSSDGDPLFFDLHSPIAARTGVRASAVVLIHGGPVPPNLLTAPKDWGLFQSLGRLIGASGLAAVMFNHRFFGFDRIRDAVADIDDLLSYVGAHGEELGIETGRLCLWAFSGGGVFLGPFLRNTPDAVRCVVAYYAALHARTPEFSAAVQLSENTGRLPALLVARAGLDLPELNDGIDQFVQQALKKNACIDVLNHATGQHGFDARDDNERTRDILRRTLEFIRIHVSE
jgi:dienelactone hydrolase